MYSVRYIAHFNASRVFSLKMDSFLETASLFFFSKGRLEESQFDSKLKGIIKRHAELAKIASILRTKTELKGNFTD